MSNDWSEPRPGVIVVRTGVGLVARLFGLPFLAIGAYFLYQILHVLVLLVMGEIANGVLSTLLMLGLMLLMAALFAAPGVLLTLVSVMAYIEVENRRVVVLKGIPGFMRETVTPMGPEARIGIVHDRKRTSSTNARIQEDYRVVLEQPGSQPVDLGWFDRKSVERARELAKSLAERLSMPVSDRVHL